MSTRTRSESVVNPAAPRRSVFAIASVLTAVGLVAFLVGAAGQEPGRAWQA